MEEEEDSLVVAAWESICPLCQGDRGIYMVHDDTFVSMRCPKCKGQAILNSEQEWEKI